MAVEPRQLRRSVPVSRRGGGGRRLAVAVALALAVGACHEGASPEGAAEVDARPGDAKPPADETGPADGAPVADAAPTDGGPSPTRAWVEVGGGARAFEPIEPGQRVPLVRGPQGGYHVWGGLRGAGFEPEGVTLDFRVVRPEGGDPLAMANYVDFLEPGTDGVFEYAAVAVIFRDDFPDPQVFHGERLRLELTVTDVDGLVLRDEVEFVADCCE